MRGRPHFGFDQVDGVRLSLFDFLIHGVNFVELLIHFLGERLVLVVFLIILI